jgi:predicted DCC family thiol-disulfide oxidoreductase YuxK
MPPSESPPIRVPDVSPVRRGLTEPELPPAAPSQPATGPHVLLYDGVCGLCQATVRWLLRHDREGRLLFAPQQWPLAAGVLARHGLDPGQVNSAVLVSDFGGPGEGLALRSDAILGSLAVLGGRWALLAALGRLVPRALRDAAYRWLARNRIRLFGAAELCALPTAAERARFLGV